MSLHYVKGNLLDATQDYICHQVNCRGVMNSGVAKAIRNKWPEVYFEYKAKYDYAKDCADNNKFDQDSMPSDYLLGTIQIVNADNEGRYVINMFSQADYGYDGKRYTSYDAFMRCLEDIKHFVAKGSSIAFPGHIGCCRGGANWNIIKTMIWETLADDYDIWIYELEEWKLCEQLEKQWM